MIEIERTDMPAAATASADDAPPRNLVQAMWRGWSGACPACGNGRLFRKYLKVADTCPSCSEELHHHRADDAPPYFTILLVGHIIVFGVLLLEQTFAPSTWVHYVIWLPLLLGMSFWFLPRIKGALVGLQWALRMHGFGGPESEEMPPAARVDVL